MIALNNSQLILALLLVVCFAASFLGRNVVLSRKLVLLSLDTLLDTLLNALLDTLLDAVFDLVSYVAF